MRKHLIPMNLQFFAEGDGNAAGGAGTENGGSNQGGAGVGSGQTGTPAFDYEKLASIISGKQNVTEESILKNYFKQQGLSQEEMASAISAFKEQKAKNTPDPVALKNQLDAANKELLENRITSQATIEAMTLGLDAKTIPYVIKLADMGKAVDAEGKINAEEIKKALTQVLTDVPALKGTNATGNSSNNAGGFQIGQSQQNNEQSQEDILKGIFGIKKS